MRSVGEYILLKPIFISKSIPQNANSKVTATTQTMPTNQTSVIQSTKAFKHSKSGNGNGNGNLANINQSSQQQPNNTATPAVIKPQVGDKPDTKK